MLGKENFRKEDILRYRKKLDWDKETYSLVTIRKEGLQQEDISLEKVVRGKYYKGWEKNGQKTGNHILLGKKFVMKTRIGQQTHSFGLGSLFYRFVFSLILSLITLLSCGSG